MVCGKSLTRNSFQKLSALSIRSGIAREQESARSRRRKEADALSSTQIFNSQFVISLLPLSLRSPTPSAPPQWAARIT
jgi:hypothetical protein